VKIKYLAANAAWCVVFGEGQIVDICGRRFWLHRAELDAALASIGLERRGREVVLAEGGAR
jgi:hypothetical protein